MGTQLQLGKITIDVIKKDIKNVHLSVHPPTGRVRISAPQHMNGNAIRLFAISKLPWIKRHQTKLQLQERETQREYIDRESHYLWGRRYLLKLVSNSGTSSVVLGHKSIELRSRQDLPIEKRAIVLDAWYREQVKTRVAGLLEKWQPLLGVKATCFYVQRMKTKWGSSNPEQRTIRLNTELARKPLECLEYVLVHELSHFISPRHDNRFISILDGHLPHWRAIRQALNSTVLRHEDWK